MSPEGAPHGLRLIGAMPGGVIMAGWFMIALLGLFNRARKAGFSIFRMIFLYGSLAYIIIFNITAFWTVAADNPDYHYAFRRDLTFASQHINQRNDRNNTYLALDEYSLQTTEFLTSANNQPYIPADLDRLDQLKLLPGQQIIFTASSLELAKRFEEFHPQADMVKQIFNDQSDIGEELIRIYEG
jgi:hypothetical protein